MKKLFKLSIIAVFLLLAGSAANYSFAEVDGYELIEEKCENDEQISIDICRPNSFASCDVSSQTLCPSW
ncbi:hypothetical protein U3A58_20515 [Algoriphagus sp. C2-6-M1]|uniref:hypothetical protein n=1 Tax=Algoriphagus persicinus TaxID=3108754 RepID=UPI002B3D340D|nr:hypothetical protein [Algoriphagus sp. C2-6-M1]MEB2782778.1 hypothetical protein [Algoriphagus sp. C2-6-M1]